MAARISAGGVAITACLAAYSMMTGTVRTHAGEGGRWARGFCTQEYLSMTCKHRADIRTMQLLLQGPRR